MLSFVCGMALTLFIFITLALGMAKIISWVIESGLVIGIILFGMALYFAGLLFSIWCFLGVFFMLGLLVIFSKSFSGKE